MPVHSKHSPPHVEGIFRCSKVLICLLLCVLCIYCSLSLSANSSQALGHSPAKPLCYGASQRRSWHLLKGSGALHLGRAICPTHRSD